MTTDREDRATDNPQSLQCLTTEHFTLQGAKNATIAESNGRTSIFLGTVSSGVVALAFIGQVTGTNEVFYAFALILLPCLFFIGVATFVRVVQTAIEDVIYTRGINRIRHYYVEVAPQIRDYFILPIYDDIAGFRTPGSRGSSRWQPFFSASAMIAVINSAIAAVFVGLLGFGLAELSALASIVIGVLFLILTFWPHRLYQLREGRRVAETIPVRFPTPDSEMNLPPSP